MAPGSAHFPASELGSVPLTSPRGSLRNSHSIHRLYSLDNCINCGYRYEYENLDNDLNGDATMPWRRLSSVVAEHYSLCPRKFANIHLPTSALRETLKTRKCSRREKIQAASAPYIREQPPRQCCMDIDRLRRQDHSCCASPKSSFQLERRLVPESVESSRRAAVAVGTIKSAPHYSNQVHRAYQSIALPTALSHASRRPLGRRPSSCAPPEVPNPSQTLPDTSPSVLPPTWNRKRKYAETQDETIQAGRHVHRDEAKSHEEQLGNSSNRLPLPRPHLEQLPESPHDPAEERPDKRLKKNVMDPEMRKEDLEADPILVIVTPKDVYCGICKRWIKLDARNDYYPGLWRKHRRTMHEVVSESQWKYIRSEKERKEEILEERERQRLREDEGTERQSKVVVKCKKVSGKTGVRYQESPPEQLKSLATHSSPSSSRMSRSCSRAST